MASQKLKTILIGTTNETKYQMYRDLLSSLAEHGFEFSKLLESNETAPAIQETLNSLEYNAITKAVTYARSTGLITLADDTGFFIPALNNEPGIAVRRWGGKLPGNVSDKEWERYFISRLKEIDIQEPMGIKRSVIACSDPHGHYQTCEFQLIGTIKVPGCGHYTSGGPLSSYFFINECNRFESELKDEEKSILFGALKLKLVDMLLRITSMSEIVIKTSS